MQQRGHLFFKYVGRHLRRHYDCTVSHGVIVGGAVEPVHRGAAVLLAVYTVDERGDGNIFQA